MTVEREDRLRATSFSDCDQAGVSQIHWMIPIALHQVGAAKGERLVELHDGQRTAPDHLPECILTEPSGGLTEQVDRLSERWPRCQERKFELLKRCSAAIVIGFARVDECDQRSCVGGRHDPSRRERSSSPNAAPDRLAAPPPVRTAPITSSS